MILTLTEAQIAIVWTDDDTGMAMSDEAVEFMAKQGYSRLESLKDLNDDLIEALEKKASQSQWKSVSAPTGVGTRNLAAAAAPEERRSRPIDFSLKALHRLKIYVSGLKYYHATNRQIGIDQLEYRIMETIYDEFQVLEEAQPGEPVIMTKNEDPFRFLSRFKNYLGTIKSARKIPVPLSYVVRATAEVPEAPDLAPMQPYSDAHGSITDELIERVTHVDPLFRTDNKTVMSKFLEALQNSPFLSTIKSFERAKDGRGAVLAFESQHCGLDKQEARLTAAQLTLTTLKFTGKNLNHTLESLATIHRKAYGDMEEAVANGVEFQLPSETTRTRYFRDAIVTTDAALLTALSECRSKAQGLLNNFEGTVTRLVRDCPVTKLRREEAAKNPTKKRIHASISEVDASPARTAAIKKTVYEKNRSRTQIL